MLGLRQNLGSLGCTHTPQRTCPFGEACPRASPQRAAGIWGDGPQAGGTCRRNMARQAKQVCDQAPNRLPVACRHRPTGTGVRGQAGQGSFPQAGTDLPSGRWSLRLQAVRGPGHPSHGLKQTKHCTERRGSRGITIHPDLQRENHNLLHPPWIGVIEIYPTQPKIAPTQLQKLDSVTNTHTAPGGLPRTFCTAVALPKLNHFCGYAPRT